MAHIPKCGTAELQIPDFRAALSQSLLPQEDYDSEKWLYVPCWYDEFRYILGTKGKKPLICIGINPSTARPDALDNTLKSVERTALFNGYDSFLMFNLYAQRATDPDYMERTFNSLLHRQNMAAFTYILENAGRQPAIWAAWGTIIEKREYLFDCMAEMVSLGEQYGAQWYTCGKRSAKGHPHHPLYLKKNSPLEEFDIAEYLECTRTKSLRRPKPAPIFSAG